MTAIKKIDGLRFFDFFFRLRKNHNQAYQYMRSHYGKNFHYKIRGRNVFVFFDPEIAQEVFIKQSKNFVKSAFYDELKPLIGEGLLVTEGETWQRQRKVISEVFRPQIIAENIGTIENIIQESMAKVQDGIEFDAYQFIQEMTLLIACAAFLGERIDKNIEIIRTYLPIASHLALKRITSLFKIPRHWKTPGNRYSDHVIKKLEQVSQTILENRRQDDLSGKDILSCLLRNNQNNEEKISERELLHQITTFMAAGHETTSSMLGWSLILLGRNPECLNKISQEVERAIDETGKIKIELKKGLPYTTAVIEETLRLYPPSPLLSRNNLESTELMGITIPKDSTVVIPIYTIQRDEEYFENPDKFDPERFYNPNKRSQIVKNSYFPFGLGPRQCIGKQFSLIEAQYILAHLTKTFHMTPTRPHSMAATSAINLSPKDEVWYRFSRK